MPRYVDGFVIPVPKRKLAAYRRMARIGGKVWKDQGALAYFECVGEDLKATFTLSFTKMAKIKPGETVVFSFIVYKSRKDRDRINAKVMKDPRLLPLMDPKKMPFDCKRMAYGGFKAMVNL